jgi:hypothetical protein
MNEARICFEKRVSQHDGARGGDFSAEKYAALFEKHVERNMPKTHFKTRSPADRKKIALRAARPSLTIFFRPAGSQVRFEMNANYA